MQKVVPAYMRRCCKTARVMRSDADGYIDGGKAPVGDRFTACS